MISLLVAIPLLFAFIAVFWKRGSWALLVIATLLNITVLFSVKGSIPIVHQLGGWKPPFGINLILDEASFLPLAMLNIFFLMGSLYTWIVKGYETLLLVLLAALNGFVLTGDLFNSFVFLEITAISGVAIAAKRENFYNAFKYLIFSGIAGAFYLLATIFSYGVVGSLNMAHVSKMALTGSALVAITTLYIVGLGVESKLFPLNGWVMGVYGSTDLAPVFLSTAVTFSMMYMVGRIFLTVFHGGGLYVIYALALATIVVGELSALFQKNLLKALAYSSVAQAGIVLSTISKGTQEMVKLGFFHLFNETMAKFVLFSVATYLVFKYSNLGGIFKKHKVLGTSFTMASFSLIGFPMFAGFMSKLMIISTSFKEGDYLLPAVILFGTLLEITYLIRWNVKLWFEDTSTETEKSPFILNTLVLIVAIVLVIVFLVPSTVLSSTERIAKTLLDWNSYVNAVLGGI